MRSTGIAKDLALERQLRLPPGFRFNPTDEELVVHYLCKMAASQPFAVPIIAEVDIYRFDPWDLPEKALCGSKEWYFFSPRDRKYPNGSRPNRSAGSGYWKATGIDKPISRFGSTQKVGVKKALVFYTGKAPQGVKTNWIMHEYRLADSASKAAKRKGSQRLDDWVLCRIYHKTSGARRPAKETRNKSFLKAAAASLPEPGEAEQINLERSDSFEESKMEEDTQTNTKACCEPEQASETASMPEARYSNDSPAALPALLSSSPGSAHNLHGGDVLQARLEEVVTGHAAGGGSSSCSDAPCGWSEECSSNQSPGGSVGDEEGLRGEEENKMGWLWWLSSELRGEEGVTESGHLPISYEDPLASPYGRFLVEPLHYAEGDGWYFTSLAADYVQRTD